MLLASRPPSPAPAPTSVCISSRKTITSPLDDVTSSMTDFSRSSNSPRNLAPATSRPMSSAITRLLCSESGTSSQMILLASPSAMAVLPTPASPISTGLFLVRRVSVCITCRISCSRPTTGSSLPTRASSVRSTLYFSSERYFCSAFWSSTRCEPRSFCMAWYIISWLTPRSWNSRAESPVFSRAAATSRCSTLMNWSFSRCASSSATCSIRCKRGVMKICCVPDTTFGAESSVWCSRLFTTSASTPSSRKMRSGSPSSSATSASSTCSTSHWLCW